MRHNIPRNDWDRAPWNRWAFQNVRQLLPTAEVWRGSGEPVSLPQSSVDLEQVVVDETAADKQNIQEWLASSYTDGFIVLYQGAIVYETYQNGMTDRTLHLAQSVSKSIVSTVAGILIGRGLLNPSELITLYLPELEATAWRGATVQQVMDMTTGVRFIEDYEALDSDIARTDIESGWKLAPNGSRVPEGVWSQILSLKDSVRQHGESFQYRSIETDVLAHCLERVTNIALPELVSQELWQPLGCEHSACFTVDVKGYALADGGFNATLRDFARFAQLHVQQGMANGRQIVPQAWMQDIHNADGDLFGAPYNTATPNGGYRNQFWIEDVKQKAYMARGVFGQLIYIDPASDFAAVKLSSWPEFLSVERLSVTLKAMHSIKNHLSANG